MASSESSEISSSAAQNDSEAESDEPSCCSRDALTRFLTHADSSSTWRFRAENSFGSTDIANGELESKSNRRIDKSPKIDSQLRVKKTPAAEIRCSILCNLSQGNCIYFDYCG